MANVFYKGETAVFAFVSNIAIEQYEIIRIYGGGIIQHKQYKYEPVDDDVGNAFS